MSFALSVLVFFFLVLPGFLFMAAFRGKIVKAAKDPVADLGQINTGLLAAFIFAPLAHACWVSLAHLLSSKDVDYEVLIFLLAGEFEKGEVVPRIAHAIFDFAPWLLAYFLTLYVASAALGAAANYLLIHRRHLDATVELLRFNNEWHYLLKDPKVGEANQAHQITATVDCGGTPMIYTGLLDTYGVNSANQLEYLSLYGPVYRRKLEDDPENPNEDESPETSDRYYKIDGDRFIIRERNITTLNIDFFYMIDEKELAEMDVAESGKSGKDLPA